MVIQKDGGKTVIDFSMESNNDSEEQLDEFMHLDPYQYFGNYIKDILKRSFEDFSGDALMPLSVKGNQAQIDAFMNTLKKEKSFISSWEKYGLEDPKTYRSKSALQAAISSFERATGVSWPFTF